MTPTELRHNAFHIKEVVQSGLFSVKFAGQVCELADHVLSTVREDDGEAITLDWLCSQKQLRANGENNTFETKCQNVIVDWFATNDCDVIIGNVEIPNIKTRGQLRRLLEGLGVGQ